MSSSPVLLSDRATSMKTLFTSFSRIRGVPHVDRVIEDMLGVESKEVVVLARFVVK